MSNSISYNIRKYRLEKGFTQKKLSELTGIAEITIRQYEIGKFEPKIDKITKIANALEININELLEDTSSPLGKILAEKKDDDFANAIRSSRLADSIKLENVDIELIKIFHSLNKEGKEKVIEYTSDISNNPKYGGTN